MGLLESSQNTKGIGPRPPLRIGSHDEKYVVDMMGSEEGHLNFQDKRYRAHLGDPTRRTGKDDGPLSHRNPKPVLRQRLPDSHEPALGRTREAPPSASGSFRKAQLFRSPAGGPRQNSTRLRESFPESFPGHRA
jgi:hypothetical protein